MSAPAHVSDRSSLLRVSEALGERVSRRHGDQLYARCPAHEDSTPSLSVTWRDTATGGRTFVHCQRGCDVREVAAALGLSPSLTDLYDAPAGRPAGAGSGWAPPARQRKPKRAPASSTPHEAAVPSSAGRRRITATYGYVDPDGRPVFDVLRYSAAPKYGARGYDTAGRLVEPWKAPPVGRRVLYRLPEVRAAIAAGRPVYVVEGEKDADAVVAAGAAATTNPFGAADTPGRESAKWLPAYTEALRGAHVVLVADRDPAEKGYPGYRHALYVAGELAEVAASLRVVEAVAGKDAHDHLSAGHGLDELRGLAVDELRVLVAAAAAGGPAPASPPSPADPLPAVDLGRERDRRRGGGDGGPGDELPVVKVRDRFEAHPDGLFKRKPDAGKDGEGRRIVLTELLPVRVRLAARVQEDLCDGAPPELTHVDLVADRDGEAAPLAAVTRRRWESCSWVSELPWAAPFEDTPRGRSTLRNAILSTSGPVPLSTAYGALGWQEIDGRPVYIHAGGAIGESGPVEGVRVHVPAPLQPFALPPAPSTSEGLRAAVLASVAVLDALPPRIAAPLLGAAYRAPLGYSRVTVMPVGRRGSGKTAVAALAAQHFAPGARYNRMPGAGAGEAAATTFSLGELRFRAGDMLLPLDDLAPDRGPERASIRAAEIARSQFNRTGKMQGTRDGGIRPIHVPRSLALLTGEEGTTVESADSRIVSLRVARGDLDTRDALPALDTGGAPEHRAALTAALVTHYAPRIPMTGWLDDTARELKAGLVDPAPADLGLDDRHAESVADLATGWRAMLDMALARGALSRDEAGELWRRAWDGLTECKRHLMAGTASRTPVERLRELVAALLTRREITLTAREDGVPDDPTRLGWEPTGSLSEPWRRAGAVVGWTDGEKVWLHPGAVFPHLDRQATHEHEPLSLTKTGLGTALGDAAAIRTRTRQGIRYNAVPVRLGASRKPVDVWELDAEWLFGTDETDDDTPAPADPMPAPAGPPPDLADPAGIARGEPAESDSDGPGAAALENPDGAVLENPGAASAAIALGKPAERAADGPTPSSAGVSPGVSGTGAGGREAGAAGHYAAVAAICAGAVAWLARAEGEPGFVELPADVDVGGLLAWMEGQRLGHRNGRGTYRGARHGYGQLWVMPDLRRRLGWPATMPRRERGAKDTAAAAKVRASIAAAGWQMPETSAVGAWMVIYRPGGRRYYLVVPEWLDEPSPFGDAGVPARTLARRLGLYAHSTGIAYQWSPAVTGLQLISVTRPRIMDADRPELPPPARRPNRERDYLWQRKPQPDERDLPFVDAWDFNGLYLGASSSLPLAWGGYERLDSPAVDLTRPGYWKVELPRWSGGRLPDPFCVFGRDDDRAVWITTPTLKVAVELLGIEVEPLEAYLATEYGRVLDKWTRELSRARKGLIGLDDGDSRAVLAAVKGTYRHGVGRLDATANRDSGNRLWRPDWRHAVMAQARYTVTYRMTTAADTGRFPLAIATDAVVYATDAPLSVDAVPAGFRHGDELGAVKHLGRVPLADVVDLLSTGRTPAPTSPDGRTLGLMDTIKAGERL